MAKQTTSNGKKAFAPSDGFFIAGQNVYARIEDGRLTLEIDLGADLGRSASGKSQKVATTGGNVGIAGGLKLGLNVYEPIVG